jgi:hypothetical protein
MIFLLDSKPPFAMHSKGRFEATEFMLFECCECGGWWLTHGAVIRMMAMGTKVPSNIAGIFWSRHPKSIAGSFPRPPDSNFALAFSSFAFAFASQPLNCGFDCRF